MYIYNNYLHLKHRKSSCSKFQIFCLTFRVHWILAFTYNPFVADTVTTTALHLFTFSYIQLTSNYSPHVHRVILSVFVHSTTNAENVTSSEHNFVVLFFLLPPPHFHILVTKLGVSLTSRYRVH